MPNCTGALKGGQPCPYKGKVKFNGFCGYHKRDPICLPVTIKPQPRIPVTIKQQPRILELFCGTGSVGKEAKRLGYEVISVDLNEKAKPTICVNILDWDYKVFPPGYFDVIWASPPCDTFSLLKASWIGRELKRFPGQIYTRELMLREQEEVGVPILNRTKEIIKYFNPKHYWIENPQTGRMKDYMTEYNHSDVCYCMYGFDYRKATRIWHNNSSFVGKMCNHKGKHQRAIGQKASKSVDTLNERYSIPPKLVETIFQCIECE